MSEYHFIIDPNELAKKLTKMLQSPYGGYESVEAYEHGVMTISLLRIANSLENIEKLLREKAEKAE